VATKNQDSEENAEAFSVCGGGCKSEYIYYVFCRAFAFEETGRGTKSSSSEEGCALSAKNNVPSSPANTSRVK